jgi:hypothetical protein
MVKNVSTRTGEKRATCGMPFGCREISRDAVVSLRSRLRTLKYRLPAVQGNSRRSHVDDR